MPQRFLRPGITNSECWNGVSWPAQSLFIRLLTLVDDYGRCDGRTPVILGSCFSMWNSLNPDQSCNLLQVEQMLQQLYEKHLIDVYRVDGKTVLQISQWQERLREGVKEKWPAKTGVAATCSNLLPSSPSPSPSPSVSTHTNSSHPTLQEVRAAASMTGMPEADAEAFWNHFEAVGWIDKNGHQIVRWQSKMANWSVESRSRTHATRSANGGNGKPLSLLDLRTIMETKKAESATIRAKHYSETAMGGAWDKPESRTDYIKLRSEIKQLSNRISNYEKCS